MRNVKKTGLVRSSAIGLAGAILLTAALCAVLAQGIYRGIIPAKSGPACAGIALGASVFASSLAASRKAGGQGRTAGLLIAAGAILICAAGALIATGGLSGGWALRAALPAAAGGALASVMSLAGKPGKGRRKRRAR